MADIPGVVPPEPAQSTLIKEMRPGLSLMGGADVTDVAVRATRTPRIYRDVSVVDNTSSSGPGFPAAPSSPTSGQLWPRA